MAVTTLLSCITLPSILCIILLFTCFSFTYVNGWCSPSDSGDCELKIRNGKKSNDANLRAIRFLNTKHVSAGAIMVKP